MIVSYLSMKLLLLLLLVDADTCRDPDDFSDFRKLLDTNIKYDPEKHQHIKYVFNEFDALKEQFTTEMTSTEVLTNKEGNTLSPIKYYNRIKSNCDRISKVRSMIENDVSVGIYQKKRSGAKYVIVRSYWVDRKGKKIRKFHKSLGLEHLVKINGEINSSLLEQAKIEIQKLMWKQYTREYSPLVTLDKTNS